MAVLVGFEALLCVRIGLAVAGARAQRYGHRFACAMCDVDWFKTYNDRYAHIQGDAALRAVAKAIAGAVRRGDVVYRCGGEEFLVLLPEQDVEPAREAMDRVRAAVARLGLPHDGSALGHVTISVGVEIDRADGRGRRRTSRRRALRGEARRT
jgi:diguanylate cyclase (GGDEF)-like protein